ncbi:carbohydrate ABC transporter permease [Mycoplasma procyoni]|uniref:carbohydrate ABC transporter permease n=1 Tax=Mycoplasma procyoni TaxID=568784 RepID=UPI00197C50FF|nr:carbohydrate ABC transporter permease [Mycoplasma procyoni]MBN3534544.1 carbohydrate ABC transporter permease [Mycoplasma procyoni]
MFKTIFKETLKYIALVSCLFFILFPLYILLAYSLKDTNSVASGDYSIHISRWDFSNYNFFATSDFWRALGLSFSAILIFNLIRITIYTTFGAAYYLANAKIKKILLISLFIITSTPEFGLFLALKSILINLNLIQTASYFNLAVNSIFSFYLCFQLAKEIENTNKNKLVLAKLDNLNIWNRIYYIYWTNLKGVYLIIIIFSSIAVWNDYLWANFVLSGTQNKTIAIWFRELGPTPSGGNFQNIQSAGAFISILFPLGIYAIFSKKITKFAF